MGATPIPRLIIKMNVLYKKLAEYYDLVYAKKGYRHETNFIIKLIKKFKIRGKNVLDVGCGTGDYTVLLKKRGFSVIGLDLNKEMLNVARKKVKNVKFIQGNMKTFKIKQKFDIIVCLFSTMNYNRTFNELKMTIKNFYNHLNKEGLLIFDMGFNKERFLNNYFNTESGKTKNVYLMRTGVTFRTSPENVKFILGYILIKNRKIYLFKDEHKLGSFSTLKIKKLMNQIGFKTYIYDSFKNKSWNKKSKKRVVFVGVK